MLHNKINQLNETIALIKCNKCTKPIEGIRCYVKEERICSDCSLYLNDQADQTVVTSETWVFLSKFLQRLSHEIGKVPDDSGHGDVTKKIKNTSLIPSTCTRRNNDEPGAINDVVSKHNEPVTIRLKDCVDSEPNGATASNIEECHKIELQPSFGSKEQLIKEKESIPISASQKVLSPPKHSSGNTSDSADFDEPLIDVNVSVQNSFKHMPEYNQSDSFDNIQNVIDGDDSCKLLEKALRRGVVNFFKSSFGASLLTELAEDASGTQGNSEGTKKAKEFYESVIQKELEYFFGHEMGKSLLKAIVVDSVRNDQEEKKYEFNTEEKTKNIDLPRATDCLSPKVDTDYESDIDMFVPPTPPDFNPANIMTTNTSPETNDIAQKFAKFFNLNVIDEILSEVECLVADELKHTHKWLLARCKNIPIVNSKWMIDSLANGNILPINDYLFEPDLLLPPFFKELDIIVCPPFSDLSAAEYMRIWQLAGARVSLVQNWIPSRDKRKRVIAADLSCCNLSDDQLESLIIFHRAPVVHHGYITKMITEGVVDYIEEHLVIKIDRNDLAAMGFICKNGQQAD